MLVTTSRRAGKESKELAQTLAHLFPFGKFFNRGEKGIVQIVDAARDKGKSRICIIFEENGKPAKLSFISVRDGNWEWISPEIGIGKWKAGAVGGRSAKESKGGVIAGITVSGSKGKVFEKLIDFKTMREIAGAGEKDETVVIASGKSGITARIGAKSVFSAKVEWL